MVDYDDMEQVLERGRKDYPSIGKRPPNLEKLFSDMGDDVNALGRGLSQGGTLNLHDETVAGIKAGGKSLYDFFTGGGDPEDLVSNFKMFRDEERSLDEEARQESPLAFTAGQIGGSTALPGGSVKSLAAQGAVAGLGASEADSIEGDLANAAVGGAIGAGVGKLGERLSPKSEPVAIGKGQTERVLPQAKPELELHGDPAAPAPQVNSAADRIAAFRKRQEQGLNVRNKSDQLAEHMWGLKPDEAPYSNQVDDITIPEDKRQLFGVPESEVTGIGTPFERMLIGRGSLPKQGRVPSFDEPPQNTKQDATVVAQALQDSPELLGKYKNVLMSAAKRGFTSFLATNSALMSRDPEFKKIVSDLNSGSINADDME